MRPIYLISKTPYDGVIHIPILTISFLAPSIDFSQYEGVILTSKQAVLALENYKFDWNQLQCICVSEGTATLAREVGAVDVEVGDGYGESIPSVLNSKKREGKWLYLRPKVVASDWIEVAREYGYDINEVIGYETTCNPEANNFHLSQEGVLIFTSPSTIRCFIQNHSILPSHKVVVIGLTTQKALPCGIVSYLSPTMSVESAVTLARQIASENVNSSPF
ncbi:MAG: uroporphyrinogen-III synthase [Sulfuricurvum sp.]|uniref:uroporphyrinogen-III synthase n=1 Tax=Sulfuricurvum sp. TaxID=2025608 RepID=UPI00261F272E|nr:uroporphyrinogen-III synthase [Sulfuricurvum sp.]MDD2828288.1 uroporphyrinogen-III synthase [Sulfuricurvum sp.]MDD4949757.1 uroporphyrinogen-III synthase [Sulfuricurvum sp.]